MKHVCICTCSYTIGKHASWTAKKQLGQFSFKGTYLPGILGWGCHNKRLQFFVLCHYMWFFGELGKKNSINRLLAPEKQHHKKS